MIRTSGASSIKSISTSSSLVVLGIGMEGKELIGGICEVAASKIVAGNSSMLTSGTSAEEEAAAGADSPAIPPTAPASRRSIAFWSRRRPSALCAKCCSMRFRHSGLWTLDWVDPHVINSQPRHPSVKPAAQKSASKSLTPRVLGGTGTGAGIITSWSTTGLSRTRIRTSVSPGFGCNSAPASRNNHSRSHLCEAGRRRRDRVFRICQVSPTT